MQKLIYLIAIFFVSFLNAQNLRIYYEYTYKIDSTNLSKSDQEMMILDVTGTNSTFCGYEKLVIDSMLASNNNRGFGAKPIDLSKSKINFVVTKNLLKNEIILHDKIGYGNYNIKENEKINWQISKETKNINNISVQKAVTNYLGRKWEAWFSEQYPIPEGPYKFFGLPGLIIELHDEKKQHCFLFAGLKKFPVHTKTITEKEIIVNKQQFNKIWKDFKKNPSKFYVSSGGSGSEFTITMDGKSYSESEILKRIEENEKEKIAKNNNFLDLQLYK
jgi:GLPGLI family protein